MHSDFRIRGVDEFDLEFLEQMFVVAADWNPENARGEEHWRADPMLEKYVGAWREGSDFGFLVEAEATAEPLGAIWMRYFDAADPGYGFVDEQTPEITLGLRDGFRGQCGQRATARGTGGRSRPAEPFGRGRQPRHPAV